MSNRSVCCVVFLVVFFGFLSTVKAQSKAALARELVESLGVRFGREVSEAGTELLTQKVEVLLAKYGDDAAEAIKKLGPRSVHLIEDAATEGAQAAKWLAKFGDNAVWVVGNQGRRSLAVRLGDDAAEAMIKHGEIAEPILEFGGKTAANALRNVSEQNGRRIAMMTDQGELAKIGRADELFGVIAKYGDRGMEFIWKNKGALAVGTALTAFLVEPDPFIEGTQSLAEAITSSAVVPLVKNIGSNTNWTLTIVALSICLMTYLLIKQWLRRRLTRR